jgi:hypothetical protein
MGRRSSGAVLTRVVHGQREVEDDVAARALLHLKVSYLAPRPRWTPKSTLGWRINEDDSNWNVGVIARLE